MGTRFVVHLLGKDVDELDAVANVLEEESRRLEHVLSRYDTGSEVARIHRDAWRRPVRLDADVWGLLERSEAYRVLTDGFFDVTAGSKTTIPPGELIKLDAKRRSVQLGDANVRLDFGGIGKGFCLDKMADYLREHGVAGLLDAGGSSLLAVGGASDHHAWPVRLRHPSDTTAPTVAFVPLARAGLSFSAVRHQGQTTSDVLDPTRRRPIFGGAACVALAPNATFAEALSTGLLAMGRLAARRFVDGLPRGVGIGWMDGQAVELEWLKEWT